MAKRNWRQRQQQDAIRIVQEHMDDKFPKKRPSDRNRSSGLRRERDKTRGRQSSVNRSNKQQNLGDFFRKDLNEGINSLRPKGEGIGNLWRDVSRKDIRQGMANVGRSSAPGVISPGSGIAGGGNINARVSSRGPGSRGGIPAIDESLDVNEKGIFKRAKNAARIEYNPQIEAIRNLIKQTKGEGQEAIQDTGNMYQALARSIGGEIPGTNQRYDQAQANIGQQYQQLASGINQSYDATAARNAEKFASLGIGDITQPALAGQTSDRDFLSQLANLQGTGIQGIMEAQQQGAVDLQRNTQSRAGMEGVNRTADLQDELADRILELRTNKTSLQGNKARSIRELTEQYRDEAVAQAERDRAFGLDAAQFRESVRQNNISNRMANREFNYGMEMDRAGLALDAAEMQAKSQEQQAADFKSLDPQERAAAKAEQLIPGSGDKVFSFLQSLINSNPNIRRGFRVRMDSSGREQRVPITPEQFGYLARKHAKLTGLPKGSIQKIATAYWQESH